jgi:hypothetical protein
MSQDPLSFAIDTNDVDTSRPVIVAGSYIARIDAADIVENKDKTGHNLLVKFSTTAKATSIAGAETGKTDDVPAGYKLSRYYPLQPSTKSPDFDFRKGLAELQDAALKCERGARPQFNPADFPGKEVVIVVKVRTQTEGQYAGETSNDVAGVRALK